MPMSHFFAYLSRMKFIRRWGLMYSTHTENIQEHSLQVALVAHALAVIRNELYGGDIDAERVALLALYHDAHEVLTGDLPTPVKYFNPDIAASYRAIEAAAQRRLLDMLPEALRPAYAALFNPAQSEPAYVELVEAADKLCAYLKCLEERAAGNPEFANAEQTLHSRIEQFTLPEVRYFLATFVPSFGLTLDELQR
jgi:5'-deoxynucleotidase